MARYIGIELRGAPNRDFFQYKDGRGAAGRYRTPKIDKTADPDVEWTCKLLGRGDPRDLPFAVHFDGVSPFEKGRYMSNGGVISATVRPDAPGGCYKYFVAVWDEKNQRIWTDDPEMIVW